MWHAGHRRREVVPFTALLTDLSPMDALWEQGFDPGVQLTLAKGCRQRFACPHNRQKPRFIWEIWDAALAPSLPTRDLPGQPNLLTISFMRSVLSWSICFLRFTSGRSYLDGVLILRGCLPSYHLKQLAQQVVVRLEGVERIDNQIQVVTPALL
jgi:hypothetical protein